MKLGVFGTFPGLGLVISLRLLVAIGLPVLKGLPVPIGLPPGVVAPLPESFAKGVLLNNLPGREFNLLSGVVKPAPPVDSLPDGGVPLGPPVDSLPGGLFAFGGVELPAEGPLSVVCLGRPLTARLAPDAFLTS